MSVVAAIDFPTVLLVVLFAIAVVKLVHKFVDYRTKATAVVIRPPSSKTPADFTVGKDVFNHDDYELNNGNKAEATLDDGQPRVRSIDEIPSPPPSTDAKLGHLTDLAKAGSLYEYLVRLHREHGSMAQFKWASTTVVSCAAPELFRETLKLNNRPALLFEVIKPFVGNNSIQFCNGPEAMQRRKIIDPFFNPMYFASSAEIINEVLNETLAEWKERADTEENGRWSVDVNILRDMIKMEIKIVCKTAFGSDLFDEEEYHVIAESYEFCWDDVYLRIKEGEPVEGSDRWNKWNYHFKRFNDCIKRMIDTKKSHGDKSLIAEMLKSPIYRDNKDVLRDDVVSVLVGAFHTSANAVTWALYHIARFADVQQKIHDELDSVLKVATTSMMSNEFLGSLSYLTKVVSETLRLSVLGPYAARYSPTDLVLGGYLIPANTPIIEALGFVLQDEKLWKDAEKFDPERFNAKNNHPLAFSPFGVGKRLCPAHLYAPLSAKFVLAKLLSECSFALTSEEDRDVKPSFNLISTPEREVFLRVSSRSA